MKVFFEVRRSPELIRAIDVILRDLRFAGMLDASEGIDKALAYEARLRAKSIERIFDALERAQAPAIDGEVCDAIAGLRSAVVRMGRIDNRPEPGSDR